MFEGDYTIYGKHATYIKYLVNDAKAFKRFPKYQRKAMSFFPFDILAAKLRLQENH